ncbi:FMN-binding protein [Bdellovibrio sp. HCB-162]|uniref:FMN-binding protein n=1 Tax=Bdellovibrio sp. HCB-162 TaxID=3394234 RepID=UPI0039BD5562
MSLFRKEYLTLLPVTMITSMAYATDYFTTEQAQKVLFPEADTFVANPVTLTDDQKEKIEEIAKVRQRKKEVQAWRAEKKGKLLGWFIIDEVIGKHEFITYSVAISPEGKVLGLEIMSYRETKGGQVRDSSWRKHFVGKTLSDPFKLDVDIPNISGATLSSRNITDGVKRLLSIYKIALQK